MDAWIDGWMLKWMDDQMDRLSITKRAASGELISCAPLSVNGPAIYHAT